MKRPDFVIILFALAGAAVYVTLATLRGATGFALDDAWIHQVYARNLGWRGEFSFFPGQASAGSTSPLWTVLLSLGYVLQVDFRGWTLLLGTVFYGLGAFQAVRLADQLFPSVPVNKILAPLVVPLFMLLEWHLAWGAVSGMEIPLFVFLSLLLLERFFARERLSVLGVIGGLLVMTRPEGLVLAGLVGMASVRGAIRDQIHGQESRHVITSVLEYSICMAVVLSPYLLINLSGNGTLLPNTFYAKNAEYAEVIETVPFVLSWFQLLGVTLVGAQVLLVPGMLYIAAVLFTYREWVKLLPLGWALILPGLFALRLPVAYQHGRYEMPIIPILLIYGVWGTGALFERMRNRIVKLTWGLSTTALVLVFWYLGASAYAVDVSIIDCEMVGSARWVAANVPPDALVAAHDIGALGYFYPRPFIDLAGLVSPEITPMIRDQTRLRDYLLARGATFAVFFPDWYPSLSTDPSFIRVNEQNCDAARQAGGTDMVIYAIVR